MIIIGIDPGYQFTGYGIIQYSDNKFFYILSGRLVLNKLDHTQKLVYVYKQLEEIILKYNPVHGVCEQVFFAKNYQSTIKLGKILGIAHCILGQNMSVTEYATRNIKSVVNGRGQATKEEIKNDVILILNLQKDISYDESDALAAAICHIKTMNQIIDI